MLLLLLAFNKRIDRLLVLNKAIHRLYYVTKVRVKYLFCCCSIAFQGVLLAGDSPAPKKIAKQNPEEKNDDNIIRKRQ